MDDPWKRSVSKMTPEQYARHLVELAATEADSAAIRIHMEGTSQFLEKADACRAWLRNGVTALTVRQIDFVLEALVVPNSPADPLETAQDRQHRVNYVRGLRAELVAAQTARS
jgi:hypothetical protein